MFTDQRTANHDLTPFVTTYSPHATFIAEVAKRKFLQSKEQLSVIFNKPPLVSHRRPKSLGSDRLAGKKLRNGTADSTLIPNGCRACQKPKCSWYNKINETQTFKSTSNNTIFIIFHLMDCQSSWVNYIIECNICRLQYIGKIETGFNLPVNNHRKHIKKRVNSCELTEHFPQSIRSL